MLDLLSEEHSQLQSLRYDYNQIDTQHRDTVIEAAIDIHGHASKARDSIIAIGERLLQVKNLLPHGQFQDWVEQEFDIERRMAQNYMSVAIRFGNNKRFGNKSEIISLFSPTAMYLLAAPATPIEAVEAAIAETEEIGQRLKVKRIKEIVAEYTTIDNTAFSQPEIETPVILPSKANVEQLCDALIASQQALERAMQAAQAVPNYTLSIKKCLDAIKNTLEQLSQMQSGND